MKRLLLALVLVALALPLSSFAVDNNPVITVPADMTVEAQSFSGATVTYTASAVDYQRHPIPVTCTPASGSIFPFGSTTVTCIARDSGGRSSTKRFKVTVVDRTPHALTVPASVRVETKRRTGAIVSYTVSATDIVDGPMTPSCSPKSGVPYAVGLTTVSCSAVDRRGNVSTKTFQVEVVLVKSRPAKSAEILSPAVGATIRTAPLLRWRAAARVRFYNVQLFRRGHKILTAWPTRPSLRLHSSWSFGGHTYKLKPGSYTWLVWPSYGPPAKPRFGKLLGQSSFRFAR